MADQGNVRQANFTVVRSDARFLTDDELLEKLRSLGVELDRTSVEELVRETLSAEEIARRVSGIQGGGWIWVCVAALWQRWFPEEPGFESLDDKMQAGYALLREDRARACRIWIDAWADALQLFKKGGIASIEEFDKRFAGTQYLVNWIQDLQDHLGNASRDDPQFQTERMALCEYCLRHFADEDQLIVENWRRDLAEACFELGQPEKVEALYLQWMIADPAWGWGWIGWSDCYYFTRTPAKNVERSEQILREGLGVGEVRDRSDILARLADLCSGQGREAEAAELCRQAQQLDRPIMSRRTSAAGSALRDKTAFDFGAANLREVRPAPAGAASKVGRNDPCPCSSGKKFKKCCGA